LFAGSEFLDGGQDGLKKARSVEMPILLEGPRQASFAELLLAGVHRFHDAIGIDGQDVARNELGFCNRALPFLEQSQNGDGGGQALYTLAPQQ